MMKKITVAVVLLVAFVALSLKPVETYTTKPDEFGMKYSEVMVPTHDGLKLKAWVFRTEKRSGEVVLISHDGNGNMENMIETASYFLSMGINVITYDYRGFGESDDFKINNKFYMYAQFEKDIDAMIKYAKNMSSMTRVYLYGKGMGGGLSLAKGATSRGISKIIADSPYDDLNSLQQRMATQGEEIMIPLAYNKETIEPRYALATKDAKVKRYLVINGSEDLVCNKKVVKGLQKIQKDILDVHTVKGAHYKTTFSIDKAAYFEAVKTFLQE